MPPKLQRISSWAPTTVFEVDVPALSFALEEAQGARVARSMTDPASSVLVEAATAQKRQRSALAALRAAASDPRAPDASPDAEDLDALSACLNDIGLLLD